MAMPSPRINPDQPNRPLSGAGGPAGSSGEGRDAIRHCRLNLLLSYAGWQPESWADRLPRLLEPMGVRAVRACTGAQATEVIRRISPIHIAVVDLGLPLDETHPQEGGPRLLDLLSRLDQPPPTVIVKSARSHRDESREIAAALRAGAFAIIDRPRDSTDLELMLEVLRRILHRRYQGRWPGLS
jgi:DNA-binding NtrC family response regulator